MEGIVFDGQQTDERILTQLNPHIYSLAFTLTKIVVILIFFYAVVLSIASLVPQATSIIRFWSTIGLICAAVGASWWSMSAYNHSKTYITDRRIMRFELLSPIYTAKRSLFWTEALKAKAYSTNIIWRILGIGTVQVEPQAAEHENVRITDIYLYEDIANYIDKIIFTVKSNPSQLSQIRSFVPKPKGRRDT